MKIEIRRLTKWIGAIAVAAVMPLAHASLTFSNGGFEGGLSPWAFLPALPLTNVQIVSGGNISSGHSLSFNSTNHDGTSFIASAQQDFGSVGVDTYVFQFWTKGIVPSQFSASLFDVGSTCNPLNLNLCSPLSFSSPLSAGNEVSGWTPYTTTIILPDADVALLFSVDTSGVGGGSAPFNFNVDDVTFVSTADCVRDPTLPGCSANGGGTVPEPGSLFLVGAALAGLAIVRRKKQA